MRYYKYTLIAFVVVVILVITFYLPNTDPIRLDVYNWPYYINNEILSSFEEEYNCKVNYREFPSNEVLYTAIVNKVGDWDVVFPSDYMVEKMIAENLLLELDYNLLSNINNLDSKFLKKSYDSVNKYSLPYIWGSTGIGFNKKYVKPIPKDYDILWNYGYKNKIGMLDDLRFTISAPLLWKSFSINTVIPRELKVAENLLLKQKEIVKVYNSENYVDLLISEEIWIFYGYSGDIIQAILENPNIDFFIPKSGGVLYIDNMSIPKTCNQNELAHKFINYLLRPEVAKIIIESKWFAMPNKGAEKLISMEIKNNTGVYPPDEVLQKCQSLVDLGDKIKLYEEIWRKLKKK